MLVVGRATNDTKPTIATTAIDRNCKSVGHNA